MGRCFKNLFPHETHGLLDVLKWKFSANPGICAPFAPPRSLNKSDLTQDNLATWIGHSSFYLHVGGKSLLVDPILSEYCAPFPIKRLKRRTPPGLSLPQIGEPDAVLLTHNHYDHLDWSTIKALPKETLYILPRGLAAWFRSRGRRNSVEFDWWETQQIASLRITCVPAQHFSSRTPWDRNKTLWCGWVIQAEGKTIYLAGDTGYCPIFSEIGKRLGPMDFSAIPIGAYEPRWIMQPVHVNPAEAVEIHRDVRSRLSVGCHWGTFCLTDEPMSEPSMRLAEALEAKQIDPVTFRILDIGETVLF